MTGIEWFEPRPPKVAAWQINTGQPCGDVIEQLRGFPGVRGVTVKTRRDGSLSCALETASYEQMTIGQLAEGAWLVVIIKETDAEDGYRQFELKIISDDALRRVYQPVVDHAARAKAALDAMAKAES